jgi:hypothetical protein
MTTTITVNTHDWPVAATVSSNHSYSDDKVRSYGHSDRTEFVPPHSERTYSVAEGGRVSFEELPKEATGLNYHNAVEVAQVGATAG